MGAGYKQFKLDQILGYHVKRLAIILALIYAVGLFFTIFIKGGINNLSSTGLFSYEVPLVSLLGLFIHIHYEFCFVRYVPNNKREKYFISILVLCSICFAFDHFTIGEKILPALLRTIYIYMIALFYALGFYRIQLKNKQLILEKDSSDAQLNSLQLQIQPHFLFNTLNSIYSSALIEKASNTVQLIEMFASLLRYTTEDGKKIRTVKDELIFIKNYVGLQKTRLSPDHVIDFNVEFDDHNFEIYPMLLLQSIENSIKYGFTENKSSNVSIDIVVKEGKLKLEVINDLPAPDHEISGTGIGIKNTQDRLKILYPGKFKFLNEKLNGKFKVKLELDLNK